MQLGAAVGVAHGPVFVELVTTLVAVPGPQVVFASAAGAAIGELATGHRHKRALRPFDDLQIADREGVVERHRAEGLQPLVVFFNELDADFGDEHHHELLRVVCQVNPPRAVRRRCPARVVIHL